MAHPFIDGGVKCNEDAYEEVKESDLGEAIMSLANNNTKATRVFVYYEMFNMLIEAIQMDEYIYAHAALILFQKYNGLEKFSETWAQEMYDLINSDDIETAVAKAIKNILNPLIEEIW